MAESEPPWWVETTALRHPVRQQQTADPKPKCPHCQEPWQMYWLGGSGVVARYRPVCECWRWCAIRETDSGLWCCRARRPPSDGDPS